MNKKTDLRILRTKQSIRKAFYELIQEKGYESITIQDIADRAMINRNTFYLHYQNKPDLLDTCMNELLSDLKDAVVLLSHQHESFQYFSTRDSHANCTGAYFSKFDLLSFHVNR